jgi:hypothetical protein
MTYFNSLDVLPEGKFQAVFQSIYQTNAVQCGVIILGRLLQQEMR